MEDIWIYIAVGFFAQMIDGCLGMAYGVLSTTFLTATGVPIANASSSVHFAEIFTTFSSGVSHLRFKNVDKNLLYKLLIPGCIGGIIGAYALSSINSDAIKPFVNTYLLILGLYILYKGAKKQLNPILNKVIPIGFLGGLLDAIGGGGWGPIVTTNLVVSGNSPRHTVGTVNTAEFFVTLVQSATFFFCLGNYFAYSKLIIGLLIGGVIAAPIAAFACKKINEKIMTILIGIIIVATNIYALLKYFVQN